MRHFFEPNEKDAARIKRLQPRLEATSQAEVIRRALTTLESLLNVQDAGGEIVLCKKGQPDKVIWFL